MRVWLQKRIFRKTNASLFSFVSVTEQVIYNELKYIEMPDIIGFRCD
jgi:hypothetical protein